MWTAFSREAESALLAWRGGWPIRSPRSRLFVLIQHVLPHPLHVMSGKRIEVFDRTTTANAAADPLSIVIFQSSFRYWFQTPEEPLPIRFSLS